MSEDTDRPDFDPEPGEGSEENPVTPGDGDAAARDGEPSNVVQHPAAGGTGRRGAPIDERDPDDLPVEPGEQEELFAVPVPPGKQEIQLNDIIRKARQRNIPIEQRFVMTGKSIPSMSGGLLDPFATSHMLLADCVVDHVKPQFVRDGDRKVERLILYCSVKPVGVASIASEQGQQWLREATAA